MSPNHFSRVKNALTVHRADGLFHQSTYNIGQRLIESNSRVCRSSRGYASPNINEHFDPDDEQKRSLRAANIKKHIYGGLRRKRAYLEWIDWKNYSIRGVLSNEQVATRHFRDHQISSDFIISISISMDQRIHHGFMVFYLGKFDHVILADPHRSAR